MLIVVSGIELAGKGEALMQLREWADPRLLKVKARLPVVPHAPIWLQDADLLPKKGEIVILFGSWYGDLIQAYMTDKLVTVNNNKNKKLSHPSKMTEAQFQRELEHVQAFEQDLQAQGITVCKCWFDLSWEGLQKRLDKVDPSEQQWLHLHGLNWRKKNQYQALQKLRKRLGSDWINIDSQKPALRNLAFGHAVLDALRAPRLPSAPVIRHWQLAEVPAILHTPDQIIMEKEVYKMRINNAQKKFAKLVRQCETRSIILVFEGMDASGKGGAISRLIKPLDPREYQVFPIAAPEPHELRSPYLWRFWSRLPRDEEQYAGITIFDRSWYGRVLVERVEGYVRADEWQSAYQEINRFERDLISGGAVIIKFWLAISAAEQKLRFNARQETPHKYYKITSDDWRNRNNWNDYLQATADMLRHTDTENAPWIVVATDDKYTARLAVLESLNHRLERVLR